MESPNKTVKQPNWYNDRGEAQDNLIYLGGSSANSQAATKQTCLVLQLQVAV